MRIDLVIPESWTELNERYRAALGWSEAPAAGPAGGSANGLPMDPLGPAAVQQAQDMKLGVQFYLGIPHALREIAGALTALFPHRRQVAYDPAAGPEFMRLASDLAAQEFTVKPLTPAEMQSPKDWFEPISKEMLFVVTSFDDPVTAAVHDLAPLDALLKDKRVFRFQISHALHRMHALPRPSAYQTNILSLAQGRVVAALGERLKVNASIASELPWNSPILTSSRPHPQDFEVVSADIQAAWRARVLQFETQVQARLTSKAKPHFAEGASRLFDRAVLEFSGVDGSNLISELTKRLAVPLQAPGVDGVAESTSLCRWPSARIFDWRTRGGHSPEALRGLVVFSAEFLLQHPQLEEDVSEVFTQILRDQEG